MPRPLCKQPCAPGTLSEVTRPAAPLIDLAAGRTPTLPGLDAALVRSATEHRMEGLVYSWAAQRGALEGEAAEILVAADAQNWARNQMLEAHAVRLENSAKEHGIEICFMKGVALESQVYSRSGERPTSDLDVLIRGGGIRDIAAWLAALQPRHMWVPHLADLLAGKHIQSLDLVIHGVPVDIHFDPLKLEIVASREADELLSRSTPCHLGSDVVTGLDAEASLVLALLHLNKDRFRRLIGYADVRRLLDHVQDWDWVLRYAETEGLTTPLLASLAAVTSRLDTPPVAPPPPAWGARLWNVAWPARSRLLGREGSVRFRYRQMLIPFFGQKRRWEATRGLLRRAFPPRPLVRAFFPDYPGGYFRALIAGRAARRMHRARQRKAATQGSGSDRS